MSPFDGSTYDRDKDGARLSSALERMAFASRNGYGKWRSLAAWSIIGECSEAAAGARLRDFNKEKFRHFGLEMQSERASGGGWVYSLHRRQHPKQLELL